MASKCFLKKMLNQRNDIMYKRESYSIWIFSALAVAKRCLHTFQLQKRMMQPHYFAFKEQCKELITSGQKGTLHLFCSRVKHHTRLSLITEALSCFRYLASDCPVNFLCFTSVESDHNPCFNLMFTSALVYVDARAGRQ